MVVVLKRSNTWDSSCIALLTQGAVSPKIKDSTVMFLCHWKVVILNMFSNFKSCYKWNNYLALNSMYLDSPLNLLFTNYTMDLYTNYTMDLYTNYTMDLYTDYTMYLYTDYTMDLYTNYTMDLYTNYTMDLYTDYT